MENCSRCGHQLGVGRFCTNCGHPIETRNPTPVDDADTAERPVAPIPPPPPPRPAPPRPALPPPPPAPPVPPPPAHAPPPVARYPLFADQIASPPPPPVVVPAPPTEHRGTRRAWLPWAIATGLALVLVAALGLVLLLGDPDPEQDPATDPATTTTEQTEPTTPAGSPTPSTTPPPTPSTTPSGEPEDVARFATVTVPATAPPNQDVSGNQVRYEGRNMLDGVPETCWRMPGDGTGAEITFTLAEPTTISRVGLINGYAKTAGRLDWYAGNRRILAVEWVFDDGSVVAQDLGETRSLQSVDVEPVTTSTIRLRILEVSKPGKGPAARNYTPISDVELVGTPG